MDFNCNLKFEKSAKTFIGYFGHRVRNRFLNAKRGLLEIYRAIQVYSWSNQPFISGDVQLSNNDQNLKLTVSGFCGFTNFGGENFDGKLGRETLKETFLPLAFLMNFEDNGEQKPSKTPRKDSFNTFVN